MVRVAAIFTALTRGVARRPAAALAVVLLLAAAGAGLALQLRPTAATDTLVGRSSPSFRATDRWHRLFGDDAVIVMVRENLRSLVLSQDVEQLLGLEGCLSGNVPRGVVPQGGRNGPCARIGRAHDTKFVFGPGTFINESATQIYQQLAAQTQALRLEEQRAGAAAYQLALARGRTKAQALKLATDAEKLVQASFLRSVYSLALRYGLTSIPTLNNPDFVTQLVFDPLKPLGTPKARFSSLFPSANTAIVQIRLRPGLGDAERSRAIGLIRAAVAMPVWRLRNGGGSYVVTGVPVVTSDLVSSIASSLIVLLIAALLVMAGTLALVFRGRPRLLPLGVAIAATALTFGALAASGASLTMASIAVLPVLIGLAVDYAIQFQSRYHEARAAGGLEPAAAVAEAAALGAPTIAAAGAATAGGFIVLALPVIGSPVPMVRDFGVLLVVGVALAFVCALTAGSAALVLAGGGGGGAERPGSAAAAAGRAGRRLWERAAPSLRGAREILAPSLRGAREIVAENAAALALRRRTALGAERAFAFAVARPTRVLGIALAVALAGWGLDTQTRVESDVQKLVPQSLPALHDLGVLQRSTHVGGEIDVMVSAPDLTTGGVVAWMTAYEQRVLHRFGYSAGRGCGQAQLCPAFSLPDLFQNQGPSPSEANIRALLAAVPPYFSQGVITPDHRVATLAFGIRLMPLSQQERVIRAMRADLHPPPGVHADLVGLPVLAADAAARVSSPLRRLGTLIAGLLAVGFVLLVALREPRRVLIPLAPIVLATGWSALVLFAVRVPLNPMSVTLGALVIAISTEFSVLLAERYRQERRAGWRPRAALERTYRSTGAAVLASGATATCGFGVLVASNIRMLRDFGFVTLVDLTVSLLGVMLVLPAVLLLAERECEREREREPGLLRRRSGALARLRARRATAA